MSEPILRLAGVRKSYGGAPALAHLDLSIARGSFFTLLGPSGSGKTTTLRLIAGFEFPDAGTIHLDGREISGTPPNRRDVNTVFQDYALFPHMTLLENVAYGLLAKRVARPEAIARARAALVQVQLADYAARKPAQLSGGQRQRVALARAIVNRPSVLLLDEPLGALDLKLRHQMQIELKELQAQTGITFVYVTHDQEEALTMSDRVAVFRQGRIEQEGTPMEIYERPANEFVADFVGTSSLLRRHGQVIMLRPEKVGIHEAGAPPPPDAHVEPALVRGSQYLGMETRVTLELGDGARLLVRCPGGAPPIPPGARVLASWHPGAAYILPVPAA